jgi:hypothetical protein
MPRKASRFFRPFHSCNPASLFRAVPGRRPVDKVFLRAREAEALYRPTRSARTRRRSEMEAPVQGRTSMESCLCVPHAAAALFRSLRRHRQLSMRPLRCSWPVPAVPRRAGLPAAPERQLLHLQSLRPPDRAEEPGRHRHRAAGQPLPASQHRYLVPVNEVKFPVIPGVSAQLGVLLNRRSAYFRGPSSTASTSPAFRLSRRRSASPMMRCRCRRQMRTATTSTAFTQPC